MNFSGAYHLAAERDLVWQRLNDVTVLQQAIPGCGTFAETGPDQYVADIQARLGPVSANFRTRIAVENIKIPESYSLVIESAGGAQGVGQGIVDVSLSEDDAGTHLLYQVEFKVRGKLAQVGTRLLGNAIRKLSNEFFDRFAANIGTQGSAP